MKSASSGPVQGGFGEGKSTFRIPRWRSDRLLYVPDMVYSGIIISLIPPPDSSLRSIGYLT